MMAWLPMVGLAVTQITVRLIGIAGMIWQERARAKSHCAQMLTASVARVALYERKGEGAGLSIIPQDLASRARDVPSGTGDLVRRGCLRRDR
jgi:hypothetical protein